MKEPVDPSSRAIAQAIEQHRLLKFLYKGRRRTVQPYCFGVSTAGHDSLRAIEVGGAMGGFGKLWTVSGMSDVQVLEETFAPDDPNYNPDDSAMTRIYCRI